MSVGEDKPTKWVQGEGQIMLSVKTKFWSIHEPLDEKTNTRIRKNHHKAEVRFYCAPEEA